MTWEELTSLMTDPELPVRKLYGARGTVVITVADAVDLAVERFGVPRDRARGELNEWVLREGGLRVKSVDVNVPGRLWARLRGRPRPPRVEKYQLPRELVRPGVSPGS